MHNISSYYLNLTDRVIESILGRKGYSLGSILEPRTLSRSYYFVKKQDMSFHDVMRMEELLKEFRKDFQAYLAFGDDFKIVGEKLPQQFLSDLSNYIYDSHDRDPSYPPKPVVPSIEEFNKVIKCFESHISSLEPFLNRAPKSNHFYIKEVLSLNNQNYLSNLNKRDFYALINTEIEVLTNRFSNEKNSELKDGIVIYLKNRETILEKHKDKDAEVDLFEQVKVVLHSDYWSEIVDYFPTIRQPKIISTESKNMFSINPNPVHYISLDKEHILSVSKTVITDRDFSAMISVITEAINLHKPENIDFINPSPINGELKIFICGKELEQDRVIKIGHLFESMIGEYNSENVVKTGNYSGNRDEVIQKNQEYLNKVAETYWLEVELTPNTSANINKKFKI